MTADMFGLDHDLMEITLFARPQVRRPVSWGALHDPRLR